MFATSYVSMPEREEACPSHHLFPRHLAKMHMVSHVDPHGEDYTLVMSQTQDRKRLVVCATELQIRPQLRTLSLLLERNTSQPCLYHCYFESLLERSIYIISNRMPFGVHYSFWGEPMTVNAIWYHKSDISDHMMN